MKRIIGRLRPFDRQQHFYVTEDGNTLEIVEPKMEDVVDTVLSLADKYGVTDVSLAGPKQFNRGLAKQIQKAESAKYNENKLQINII